MSERGIADSAMSERRSSLPEACGENETPGALIPVLPAGRQIWPIFLTLAFAIVWIFHRAAVQSITIDEANTFLRWVAPSTPEHWVPNANNHIPNSLLMRLAVWMFGISHLAVRGPALLGGLLYAFSVTGLCLLMVRHALLRWALLVCFLYNPFVMDYLVVARGYGMALGFQALSLYFFASLVLNARGRRDQDLSRDMAKVSVCTILSFSSNFAFAYANAFLLLAFFGWAFRHQRKDARAKLIFAATVPGLIVGFLLVGSVLARFPKEELFWGTRSLMEMWREIRTPVFPDYNPHLVHPVLAEVLRTATRYLLRAAGVGAVLYLALLLARYRKLTDEEKARLFLAISLAAIFGLTFLAHWLQFRLFGILLPLERTSLFFVPLLTGFLGALFSVEPTNVWQRLGRAFGILVLTTASLSFLASLRDSYFLEWKQQADVRAAFPVLYEYCRSNGIRDVAADGFYASILNFYRILDRAQNVDEFRDDLTTKKRAYVLRESQYGELIRQEGLRVLYRGPTTDLVIAIRDAP